MDHGNHHMTSINTIQQIDNYLRDELIYVPQQREVFIAVVTQLLASRCARGKLKSKAIYHARNGDIYYTRKTLAKIGIPPTELDAILPLIRG